MCKDKQCDCELCVRGKRLRSVAGKLDEDDAKWLIDFGAEFLHVRMDRSYYKAIMDGSWPSSVETLEQALKRAREKQEDSCEPR